MARFHPWWSRRVTWSRRLLFCLQAVFWAVCRSGRAKVCSPFLQGTLVLSSESICKAFNAQLKQMGTFLWPYRRAWFHKPTRHWVSPCTWFLCKPLGSRSRQNQHSIALCRCHPGARADSLRSPPALCHHLHRSASFLAWCLCGWFQVSCGSTLEPEWVRRSTFSLCLRANRLAF